jgi:membrane protein DedA with SNARE-associated domain
MTERVTLDDLESKLRDLGGSATSAAAQAKAPVLGAAAAGGVLAIAAVYVLGRRRGRKEAPVLEIRRI